ncbi:hypothetical protein ES702_03275 [subsurface metagenome]
MKSEIVNKDKPQEKQFNRMIIVAFLVIALVLTSVVVLKFVPLKYEESSYSREVTLEPQQIDTRWFTVPKGYTVSGTYSVSNDNLVELSVYYQSVVTYLRYSVCSEESSSGSFSFKAEGYAAEDKYHFSLKNPASSGFFGYGAGETITVTVEFKVCGYTTYI